MDDAERERFRSEWYRTYRGMPRHEVELAPLALAAAVGLAFLALLLEQMGVIR